MSAWTDSSQINPCATSADRRKSLIHRKVVAGCPRTALSPTLSKTRGSDHQESVGGRSILRLAKASLGRNEDGYCAEFVELVRKVSAISLHEAAKFNENAAAGNPGQAVCGRPWV